MKQVTSAMDKRIGSRASDSDTTTGYTHIEGYKTTLFAVGTMLWGDLRWCFEEASDSHWDWQCA
jgi:hypothetical protein